MSIDNKETTEKQQNTETQNKYSKEYSEKSLFEKIKDVASSAGISVIYAGLLLYFTLEKAATPLWAKGTIVGALGYFIVPLDAIADIAPVVGYSDDFGAIMLALGAVAMYIDEEVKAKAKAKLKDWFGEYDANLLNEIDNKTSKN
ncbi:DUF1232 domain-containing protein [Petroclostridium sp. X23]|uniref:YkvA family protein n=1 Tax=Petroclostridium sp. X23 TaxID=3045146 RepID=UPI0024AD62E2|nr:DUF1232 domain-containing protein [Petroclostridium sp. X23]WHH57200.1 DUF1232 domain-containing protein [Petroclostridium sp. X23]